MRHPGGRFHRRQYQYQYMRLVNFLMTCTFLSILLAISHLGLGSAAYANPQPCAGICTNAHDPSIIRRDSDGRYFRFSTGGKIAMHTAPNITGPWSAAGPMLSTCSTIKSSGNCDLWAPDVHKVNDMFYVYYSVSTFGSQDSSIGLATSPTMEPGTWTDLGSIGINSSKATPFNAIDPNLIKVGSDFFLNFGSFWKDIYQVQMSSDPRTAMRNSTASQIAYVNSGDHAAEGSYMIFHTSYYYLFFSVGSCCGYDKKKPVPGKEYKVLVCRSTTPIGGFIDKNGTSCTAGGGTVVLESHDKIYGPGGQSLYHDLYYGWVIVYHYVNIDIGFADAQKQFGVNKIGWSEGWPSIE